MKHRTRWIALALCAVLMLSSVPALAQETALQEAPMLAQQVAEGKLPGLEERLPAKEDIMIEPVVEGIGQYGGSLNINVGDSGRWTWGPYVEQSMFRFKQDGSGEVEPNICKNYYANEDYTVWTIELRKGMKWSDGQPLTADDLLFYYDHMSVPALNADRSQMSPDGEGYYNCFTSKPYNCFQVKKDGASIWAKMEKVDTYTVTLTFAAPKYTFPTDAAVDNKWMVLPKHFYQHYVSRKDGVTDDPTFPFISEEQALENANRDFGRSWDKYSSMGKAIGYYHWDYYIVPQVRSFIATQDNWNKVGEVYELVRNPYFFKTDEAGNQLPYLDSIKVHIINEQDQAVLKAMAGELDYYLMPTDAYSTIVNATKATHHVMKQAVTNWAFGGAFLLNQTVKDADKRALFQNGEFRQALSLCVDRELLSATLSNGQAEPAQASVPAGGFGHDEAWYYKWTDYDVSKANELLDGLTEPWDRKAGTFRKMKGTDRELEIIFSVKEISKEGDYFTLIKSAFEKIGVKLSEKVDTEINVTILANDHEACFETVSCSSPVIRPDELVPMRNYRAWYGAYGKWYEDGKSEANGGVAPTGDILKLVEDYEIIKYYAGADRDEAVAAAVQDIFDLHKKNVWVLGYLADLPARALVSNQLHNLPETIVNVDEFRYNGLIHFEQVWKEGK